MPAILIELISNKYFSTGASQSVKKARYMDPHTLKKRPCLYGLLKWTFKQGNVVTGKSGKQTQKGTEKLIIHDSRTGVSQGHFKEIWDPVRSLNFHGSARHCNRCGPTAGTHSRRSSDHLHTNFQVSKSCMT